MTKRKHEVSFYDPEKAAFVTATATVNEKLSDAAADRAAMRNYRLGHLLEGDAALREVHGDLQRKLRDEAGKKLLARFIRTFLIFEPTCYAAAYGALSLEHQSHEYPFDTEEGVYDDYLNIEQQRDCMRYLIVRVLSQKRTADMMEYLEALIERAQREHVPHGMREVF